MKPPQNDFERLLARDSARERRIFWGEIATFAVLGLLVAVYLMVR